MYSKFLIFFFTVFVFLSCSDEITPSIEKNDYFPLLEKYDGLYWKYKTSMSDSILIVECRFTEEIEGKNYAVFISRLLPSNVTDTSYFRKDDKGNIFKYEDGLDILYIDFSGKKPEDTINYNLYYVYNYIDSLSVLGRIYFDVAFVSCKATEWDAGSLDYYAKNIGLIKRIWFIGEMELVEYNNYIY